MTKKITISVPDDLHEKMEKWKASFNFSGIFQEAVRERINRKEAFKQRLKEEFDMEAAIERLRSEKAEVEQDFFNQGKNDGLEWAKNAHYEEIRGALEWDPGTQTLPDDEGLREEINTWIEEDPDLDFEYRSGEMTNETFEWAKGWVEGVKEFWDEVKGKI